MKPFKIKGNNIFKLFKEKNQSYFNNSTFHWTLLFLIIQIKMLLVLIAIP